MTAPAVMPPNVPPPLIYDNFAKGITDYYVDPPQGYARKLDNLLLTLQGKPYQRPGSQIWNTTSPALTNNERIGAYVNFVSKSAASYTYYTLALAQNRVYACLYDANAGLTPGAWSQIADGVGNAVIFGGASARARFQAAKFGEQILVAWESDVTNLSASGGLSQPQQPVKIYQDKYSGSITALTAGLPKVPLGLALTANNVGAGHTYLYYGTYSYSFTTAAGTFYIVEGSPVLIGTVTSTVALGGAAHVTVSTSGALVGGASYANAYVPDGGWLYPGLAGNNMVKFSIYRTIDAGTVPYFVAAVGVGNGDYVDNSTDAAITNNGVLYTNDGTLGNDLPPYCRFAIAIGQCGYYANCVLASKDLYKVRSAYPQRLYQSSPGILDGVPGSFFLDFEAPITGLSYYDTYPLVFLQSAHYRVEGIIDQRGNGTMTKALVSGSTGCLSNTGIVVVGRKVYFPGNDGFYMCNGYMSEKISGHLNKSYLQWTATAVQRARITGTYNPFDNRIYWGVMATSASTDNDLVVVLDLNLGSEQGAFTTWSYTQRPVQWYATALTVLDDGSLLRGDKFGFTYQHSSTVFSDLNVDVNTSSTTWAVSGVVFDLQTPVSSGGDAKATKWCSKIYSTMYHQALGQTAAHLQFNTERERNGTWKACAPFFKTGLSATVDSDLSIKRMVPAAAHRSRLRGWQITRPWVNLYKSDDFTTAAVTGANTVQLVPSQNWPSGIEKIAKIAFANDGYVAEFLIATRSGDTVTVAGGLTNGAGQKWVIRNYPPSEFYAFEKLEIPFVVFGGHGNTLGWTPTEDNKNA